jgi:hypothetical protein
MKLTRLGTFTFGVVITAASVGAVSFANAAGDVTIKTCANKKTGAMRYITKGSCKKTEKSLSWNQMGPQGLPGAVGAAGTKGEPGSNGTNGTNGQNLMLVNSNGTEVGQVFSASSNFATVKFGSYLWEVNLTSGALSTSGQTYYQNSTCTTPVAAVFTFGGSAAGKEAASQISTVDYGQNNTYESTDKVYKLTGTGFTPSSQNNLYYVSDTSCLVVETPEKAQMDRYQTLFTMTEISIRPTLIAPLTIAAK